MSALEDLRKFRGILADINDDAEDKNWIDNAIQEIESLKYDNATMHVCLYAIRQWDMLDSTTDGEFWKKEIDKTLNGERA